MDFKISEFVRQYTEPVYTWISSHGLIIALLVVIWIEVRVSKKFIQGTKAKKWSKYEYGNTNEWFSLDTSNTQKNEET